MYIIYNDPLTSLTEICIPAPNIDPYIVINKDLPKDTAGNVVPYIILDELPQTKYIDSLVLTADNLYIQDRGKLHALKKQEWRFLRKPLLDKYDILFMRALENGQTAEIERIKLIKQQLRDVTDVSVDELTNAELEEYTPSILQTA